MNADPGASGAPAGGDPAAAPAAAPAPAEQSALATAGAAPVPLHERIPEKYRVFGGEDGKSFDLEQSAGKLADAYGHLEKRLGTGELPPESADGYKIDGEAFGEQFNVDEFMKGEATQSFLKAAHAKGMTNAQVQFAVEYALGEFAPQLMQGSQALSAENCIKELQTNTWKDAGEFRENMSAANRAFMATPDSLREKLDKKFGNDPDFIQFAAQFGREMREDSSVKDPQTNAGMTQADVDKIMLSEAYKNERHPDHQRVSKQVQDWYNARFSAK